MLVTQLSNLTSWFSRPIRQVGAASRRAEGGGELSPSLDVSPHERGMHIRQDGLEGRVEFIHFINL